MEIRSARSADADAVNVLLDQLGYPQDGLESTAARIQTWIDDRAYAVYVADDSSDLREDIAGLIAVQICRFFERESAWARITTMVVSDRARGRGTGTRLVAAAESFAAAHGCIRMEVTSADRRQDAHRFYRGRGYVDQTGTSTRFLRDL
jgi:GNAT superfamily N-acetyltransferase